MTPKLFLQALTKFVLGLLTIGLLLFLPAGTFNFWQAWLFIGVLFVPMFIAGIVLMIRQPELLRKRLDAKEQQQEQKWVVALSGLMFIAVFVVAGPNRRFEWFLLPDWAVYIATAIFLVAYAMYAEVMRENVWLSRTVEVQENQQVVSTGLYGIVRHPHVCSHIAAVPLYAVSARLAVVICHHAHIYPYHRTSYSKRRAGA